ncbi:UNVERIFIED_CONTAM: hypothetical protein Sindi_0929500 [Sesamum indicum]
MADYSGGIAGATPADIRTGRDNNDHEVAAEHVTCNKLDKKSRKKTKGDKVNIIDSAETPFMDLFVTDAPEDLHEIADKKLDLKTSQDVHVITGFVTLPAKKNKKRNRVDPVALELSQVDEIGLGGPSAWDDI